jgi:hypothetical protein
MKAADHKNRGTITELNDFTLWWAAGWERALKQNLQPKNKITLRRVIAINRNYSETGMTLSAVQIIIGTETDCLKKGQKSLCEEQELLRIAPHCP